jgi:hypothetical protein
MDWFSLIPAALGALGGLFGGNSTSTTTTTPKLDPALKAAGTDALTRATAILHKPYTPYTGQRVAGPTASRTALDPILAQIGQKVQGGMNDANGYQARISQLMNRGPGAISAPTMVPGGPMATYARPATVAPVPVQ